MNFVHGLFLSVSHWIWFSAVAIFFSAESLRVRILARQQSVDRVIGALMVGLGVSLVMPGFSD